MATFNGTEGNDTIIGGAGADELNGNGGNDFLQGGDGADAVVGGSGNDTMSGNNGNDWMRGGTGNDQVSGGGGQDSFAFADFGAANADVLTDFASNWDNIQLDLNAFTALGSTGRFVSGDARFRLGAAAQDADDRIIYNQATGQLWYDADGNGAGAAQLIATLSNRGAMTATDIYVFQPSTPPPPPPGTIDGTPGNDTLVGTAGNDTINGLGGHDLLEGRAGNDSLSGGDGNDTLYGDDWLEFGDDTLSGGSGNDDLSDRGGRDVLLGGDGADTLRTGFFSDDAPSTLDGGLGNDTYELNYKYDGQSTFIDAGGVDTFYSYVDWTLGSGFENLTLAIADESGPTGTGNELDNVIRSENGFKGGYRMDGAGGNDTLLGAGNPDTFLFGAAAHYGRDLIDGGGGADEVSFTFWGVNAATSSATIDLRAGTVSGGMSSGSATLANVEDATGGAFNDLLIAHDGMTYTEHRFGEVITRGAQLDGAGGNDTLQGGADNDRFIGGDGADVFRFTAAPGTASADDIVDFASGTDEIHLDARAMAALGASGRLSAADPRFYAAAGATAGHDADDRLVFNTNTGELFYDADGSGSASAQLIATVHAGSLSFPTVADLAATDILVLNGAPGQTTNGTEGNDSLVGTELSDTINGLGGNDTIRGLGGADSLVGGDGVDSVVGGDGSDTLVGHDGFTERGSTTADTLDGGLGDDVYIVSSGDVIAADPGGIDSVFVEGSWTLGSGLDNLRIQGIEADGSSAFGNELDNTIDMRGVEHYGTIMGGAGNDQLFTGQKGGLSEGVFGGSGNDTLVGDSGADQLFGGDGNDVLRGSVDIVGSDFNRLDGGAGNDTLTGSIMSEFNDTFVFSVAPGAANADTITAFDSGTDRIELDANAHHNVGAVGAFAANDPRFYAAAGANGGHDLDDRVILNTTTGQLWYDSDGSGVGVAQLIATIQNGTVVATDITIVIGAAGGGTTVNGTAGNDSLLGTAGSDTINGFGGNDTIDGLGGVDSMVGGTGDDVYFVDEANDIVVEAQNGGIDEVRVNDVTSYTLPDFVNNLTLVGQAQMGIGNSIDNVIRGSENFSILYGREGNDTLIGGGVVSGETADTFIGGPGNDSMVGGSAGNGFDVFHLLEDTTTSYGNDTIIGAGGEDWIFADGPATVGIVVDLPAGTLTGGYAGSSAVISGIENVGGTHLADRMTGDGAANEFDGGGGNDTLNGGAGNDRLGGGDGADTFILANAPGAANADNIVGFASGVDEIRLDGSAMSALGASGDFIANDPRFRVGTAAQDADDRIVFNGATGELWYDSDGSGAGAQQLIATLQTGTVVATDFAVDNGSSTPPPPPPGGTNGTEGNDTMIGTAGADTLNGLGGNDFMQGGDGTDTMRGGAGNDTLSGNGGNDWMEGGAGNDQVSGGGGQDAFVFREFGAANADRLTDFASNWDNLRFDNAAFTALGADGRFASGDARFRAGAAAADADDRVVFNSATGQVWYDTDGNGAGAAQLVATLQAGATLVASDIWVI